MNKISNPTTHGSAILLLLLVLLSASDALSISNAFKSFVKRQAVTHAMRSDPASAVQTVPSVSSLNNHNTKFFTTSTLEGMKNYTVLGYTGNPSDTVTSGDSLAVSFDCAPLGHSYVTGLLVTTAGAQALTDTYCDSTSAGGQWFSTGRYVGYASSASTWMVSDASCIDTWVTYVTNNGELYGSFDYNTTVGSGSFSTTLTALNSGTGIYLVGLGLDSANLVKISSLQISVAGSPSTLDSTALALPPYLLKVSAAWVGTNVRETYAASTTASWTSAYSGPLKLRLYDTSQFTDLINAYCVRTDLVDSATLYLYGSNECIEVDHSIANYTATSGQEVVWNADGGMIDGSWFFLINNSTQDVTLTDMTFDLSSKVIDEILAALHMIFVITVTCSVVGAVCCCCCIGLLIYCCCCRKKKEPKVVAGPPVVQMGAYPPQVPLSPGGTPVVVVMQPGQYVQYVPQPTPNQSQTPLLH